VSLRQVDELHLTTATTLGALSWTTAFPLGIDWVEIGGDRDRPASWLGHHELHLRHVAGASGPHRVAVAIANREPIVIG
jgi:hypothetical protein